MNYTDTPEPAALQWFAIKTRKDFKAQEVLAPLCDEVFFPTEEIRRPDGRPRRRAVIPHVLFVRTTSRQLLDLEARSHRGEPELPISFTVYRYPQEELIRPIPPASIHLLRLLTGSDTDRCRLYTPDHFTPGEHVRITGGMYRGYTGFVKRIAKNKHVIVRIEGICMVILPYIHPDLLQKLD